MLEEVGRNVRAWRDSIMLETNWDRLLTRRRFGGLIRKPRASGEVVSELVERLGERLPEGFDLRLINPNIDVAALSK